MLSLILFAGLVLGGGYMCYYGWQLMSVLQHIPFINADGQIVGIMMIIFGLAAIGLAFKLLKH